MRGKTSASNVSPQTDRLSICLGLNTEPTIEDRPYRAHHLADLVRASGASPSVLLLIYGLFRFGVERCLSVPRRSAARAGYRRR